MFLISFILLASLFVPARPLPTIFGGAPSANDAIEIAEFPATFPDFNFHVTSATLSFDTPFDTIRIQILWNGKTPGTFYVSFPFKVDIVYLYGNGENRTAVTLVNPLTQSRNGVDWYLSFRDISHGIDLMLHSPDIVAHGLWKDSLLLDFGVGFVPEMPSSSTNGTEYALLAADSVNVHVSFPQQQQIAEASPSPTGFTFLGGEETVTWAFSESMIFNLLTVFIYSAQLSLLTHGLVLARIPPMLSIDVQQPILIVASLLLGAEVTLFVERPTEHKPKVVSVAWVAITLLFVISMWALI